MRSRNDIFLLCSAIELEISSKTLGTSVNVYLLVNYFLLLFVARSFLQLYAYPLKITSFSKITCLEFLIKMPGKPGKCLEFQSDCSVDTLN